MVMKPEVLKPKNMLRGAAIGLAAAVVIFSLGIHAVTGVRTMWRWLSPSTVEPPKTLVDWFGIVHVVSPSAKPVSAGRRLHAAHSPIWWNVEKQRWVRTLPPPNERTALDDVIDTPYIHCSIDAEERRCSVQNFEADEMVTWWFEPLSSGDCVLIDAPGLPLGAWSPGAGMCVAYVTATVTR